MRKVLPYLGASLTALAMAWSTPVVAQDSPFRDLDPKHWAYEAVTDLASKGIIVGYPEGYFRGKKLLTRYEFAVALDRALKRIMTQKGDPGEPGPKGDPASRPQGPGIDPAALDELRRLIGEFRNELNSLGVNLRDVQNRLDALAKDVADIKDQLNRMPKWSGSLLLGARADRSRFGFWDQSGAARPATPGTFPITDVVHDLHLKVTANLGRSKFTGDLVASNYLSYRGGTLSTASVAGRSLSGGTPTFAEQIFPYQAQLDIPLDGFGRDGKLTLGRYKNRGSMLTYYRPDLDVYFDSAEYDDGNFVGDGGHLSTRFGSLGFGIWGAAYNTPVLSSGPIAFNQPLAGGVSGAGINGLRSGLKFGPRLVGINSDGLMRAMNQAVGVNLDLPIFHWGTVGATAIHFASGGSTAVLPYTNVTVYGAHFKLTPGRFRITGEAAKSVTTIGKETSDGQSNDDNNAFQAGVGYGSRGLDVAAGYQYIDPRFGAPGYWLSLGNIINPTNIQGPYVDLKLRLFNRLDLRLGGNYLWGARNRTEFSTHDSVYQARGGVTYNFNDRFALEGDYQGVFYDLTAGTSASGSKASPTEQYMTLAAKYSLSNTTMLKLAYQYITFDNKSGGWGNGVGLPLIGNSLPGGGGSTSHASVVTFQTQVRF